MPPKVEGELAMTRTAFTFRPNSSTSRSSSAWTAALCPRPWNSTMAAASSRPCSVPEAFRAARTGESFSRVSGSLSPTSSHSARRREVPSGTVKPACSAIHRGDLPTTAGLSFASGQSAA